MKKKILLVILTVFVIIMLAGCQIGSTASAAKAIGVADTTTHQVNEEPVLIASVGILQGLGRQAALAQGYSLVGASEMQLLPNGEVMIKLKSDTCDLSLDATNGVNEEIEVTAAKVVPSTHTLIREPILIVSAGKVQGLWQASLTQGHSVVDLYEIQPLPNDQVTIKLKKANVEGGLSCRSV